MTSAYFVSGLGMIREHNCKDVCTEVASARYLSKCIQLNHAGNVRDNAPDTRCVSFLHFEKSTRHPGGERGPPVAKYAVRSMAAGITRSGGNVHWQMNELLVHAFWTEMGGC